MKKPPGSATSAIIVPFLMQRLLLLGLAVVVLPACPQDSGAIRGSVVDARGGEALANVQVQLTGGAYRTVSDSKGSFQIPEVGPATTC